MLGDDVKGQFTTPPLTCCVMHLGSFAVSCVSSIKKLDFTSLVVLEAPGSQLLEKIPDPAVN